MLSRPFDATSVSNVKSIHTRISVLRITNETHVHVLGTDLHVQHMHVSWQRTYICTNILYGINLHDHSSL